MVMYAFYALGGFAAISWLSAAACIATIALLLRRNSAITGALAIVAVPAISFATTPRAEMFTTVLFAAFIAILWRQFQGERTWLWLLPPLMLAWVNLHLGFIAGLAMMAAYVMLELLEMPFAGRRSAAVTRLRRTAPWLLATALVTLLNPWGLRLYVAIDRQERSMQDLGGFINHWLRPYTSLAALREALNWHDPDGGFWWLVAAAIVAVLVSLWRRQLGMALLLAGATYLSLTHLRYQGLFACLAVTLGGAALSDIKLPEWSVRARRLIDARLGHGSFGALGLARLVLLAGMLLLVVIRGRGPGLESLLFIRRSAFSFWTRCFLVVPRPGRCLLASRAPTTQHLERLQRGWLSHLARWPGLPGLCGRQSDPLRGLFPYASTGSDAAAAGLAGMEG